MKAATQGFHSILASATSMSCQTRAAVSCYCSAEEVASGCGKVSAKHRPNVVGEFFDDRGYGETLSRKLQQALQSAKDVCTICVSLTLTRLGIFLCTSKEQHEVLVEH